LSVYFGVPKTTILGDPSDVARPEYTVYDFASLLKSDMHVAFDGKMLSGAERDKVYRVVELLLEV
jgi:hypothetical protein